MADRTRYTANLVSDSNLYVDIVNDRVGIGTTIPTSKLSVNGNFHVSGIITAGNLQISSGIVTATSGVVTYYGDGSQLSGIFSIKQNSQSSAYILSITDVGKHVAISTGGVTVPASVFSAGDAVSVYNNSASNQSITQGMSVTMYLSGTSNTGTRTLAQRGVATVLCVGSNTFVIFGTGLT